MADVDDIVLLREYVERNSEPAFAGIVQRHINLVYSVAIRFTGNSEDAQDVTQAVFIILAKKAARLRPKTVLTGWLYETTRFTAMNFLTNKNRRQTREQEAYMQSALNDAETEINWRQLAPLLESAMSRLNEKDRMLVALRFFENRSLTETASLLGVNEWAARKRAERALEKLRAYLSKRGVDSTAATIAGAISANSIQAAPLGLAKTISTVAVTKGAVASTSTLTLVKGALKVMAWSKTKTTITGVAIALLGIGAITVALDVLLPAPDVQGVWEGTFNIPGSAGVHRWETARETFVMRIARVNGAYQVKVDNLGAGDRDKFDTFTYKYPYVYAENSRLDISCIGKMSRFGETLAWKSREGTNVYAMVFTRTTHPTPFPQPLTDAEFAPRADSALQGFWVGKIGLGKDGLRIQVKIAEASDGTYRADFYVPDQATNRLPSAVTYDGTTVKVILAAGYGMFEGWLRNGGNEIAGNWIQDDSRMRTTLTKANYLENEDRGAK
ncbi:MAG TPA: sigma-70 family RNA polymerase sigma factor [Verrucomicrobiae bacterium]|jgi:RNA polymerase sigma factor (sigma-70 family)